VKLEVIQSFRNVQAVVCNWVHLHLSSTLFSFPFFMVIRQQKSSVHLYQQPFQIIRTNLLAEERMMLERRKKRSNGRRSKLITLVNSCFSLLLNLHGTMARTINFMIFEAIFRNNSKRKTGEYLFLMIYSAHRVTLDRIFLGPTQLLQNSVICMHNDVS
jgi:hypothetical protein